MKSVICHLISVICLLREETDRAVQKANTLDAAANDGIYLSFICYMLLVSLGRRWIIYHLLSVIYHLLSVICLSFICYMLFVSLGRRQIIYHLLSVICQLWEETDRAVQKADTLEAALKDGIYLSFIYYMLFVSLGRRQIIYRLSSVICLLREETYRVVQKANTLKAAAKKRWNLLSVILYLISVI
jgi:hypothetical protein